MKTAKLGIAAAVALLLASPPYTFAIEGLTLSLQCSNVVLSWPSIPYQNYIVQYRPTLDPSTPWVTLTSAWPGDPTTNITYFVHSNVVQNPNCGGGSFAMMAGGASTSASEESLTTPPSVPLAAPANGSGSAVPLALYPPGFDLSAFFDL